MSAEAKIVEVAIAQVKGFLYPTDAERAAAYELLIELTTRPSGSQIASTEGTIDAELRDIEELFDLTRTILRTHGIDSSKGSGGNLSLAVIALRVLNEVFRPVLSRWRPLLDDHEAHRPTDPPSPTASEWERRWDRAPQCRAELSSMRSATRAYIETLSHIAGAPAIADAILSAPSSAMFPRTRIESSLRPADTPATVTPRTKMVRWLDPVEMFQTWRSTSRAKAGLERFAALEIPADRPLEPDARFDGQPGTDFWFDYVADMGDGFDGTAPVAWLIGRESIELPDHRAGEIPTPPASMPHADLLVFGGDEIYPFAEAGGYESQTELPYRMGLDDAVADRSPTLVAIPGNHDWLGGIEHFEEKFVEADTFADHWRVVQKHPWWHVALPQGWWLWGIDTGLHNELVGPQDEYFRRAAESLRPGDRVILCTPVPLWQLRQKYPEAYASLRGTFDPLIAGRGATMPLCLSGDTHFFAHLERVDTDEVEDHITSGGGGAFLQPTHNIPERVPLERGNAEFKLTSRWPLPADSRAIAPGAKRLLDPQYWPLMIFGALLHLGFAALVGLHLWPLWSVGDDATSTDGLSWTDSARWTLSTPLALAMLAVVAAAGVVAFRGNSVEPKLTAAARVYGLIGGTAISTTLFLVTATRLDLDINPIGAPLAVASLIGGVLSIGLFLAIVRWANRRIKAADTLAFSPAYSTRFKHFVRFRIGEEGDLTCYVVGIDPVGEGWYEAMTPADGEPSSVPPYDPAGSPRLHYVWGKTYSKFVPHPVNVALSISSLGTGPGEDLAASFVDLAESLIDGGHTLMYGGIPGHDYTERLHLVDRERHRDNPNAIAHLVAYVADQYWVDDESAESASRLRRVHVRRTPEEGETEIEANIENLTAMRRLMTAHADVRIVLGGDVQPGAPGTRRAPGVLEEAFLAVEAGVPLLVAGGFGGAAGLIADAILGRLDPRTVEELGEHFVTGLAVAEMIQRFSSTGVLRNGLTDGENRELLRTRDPSTITSLVTRSVQRVGVRHAR